MIHPVALALALALWGQSAAAQTPGGDAGAPAPRWRTAPKLSYPAAARLDPPEDGACRVRFIIDAFGVPTGVRNEGCADVFFAEVEAHHHEARFWPPKVDGVRQASEMELVVRFKASEGPPPVPRGGAAQTPAEGEEATSTGGAGAKPKATPPRLR